MYNNNKVTFCRTKVIWCVGCIQVLAQPGAQVLLVTSALQVGIQPQDARLSWAQIHPLGDDVVLPKWGSHQFYSRCRKQA
jgi:hypothetical protein